MNREEEYENMAFIQMNVMSASLGRTVEVDVILPADKLPVPGQTPHKGPYKTLYLLHGIFGSQHDWLTGTGIQRWAEERDLAVVMPAGENRFYVDQPWSHAYYGEFIGRELVELTRKMFPLSDRREDTFLAGLSMGGYGAVRNGLKYSDTFGYVAGLSVANPGELLKTVSEDNPVFFLTRSFYESCFGPLDAFPGSDKDLYFLADKLMKERKSLPKMFLACGLEDPLLEINRKLRNVLEEKCWPLTYEEGPGAHEWDFWNRMIRHLMDWLPLEGTEGLHSGHVQPCRLSEKSYL